MYDVSNLNKLMSCEFYLRGDNVQDGYARVLVATLVEMDKHGTNLNLNDI